MPTFGANNTTCEACISIVDQYHPQSTTKGPKNFSHDRGVIKFTRLSLLSAQELISGHYRYSKDIINDACSDHRCDVKNHSRKDFLKIYTRIQNLTLEKDVSHFAAPNAACIWRKFQESSSLATIGINAQGVAISLPFYKNIGQSLVASATTLNASWHRSWLYHKPVPHSFGVYFFRATVTINPTILNASQNLFKALYSNQGYNISRIHIQLNCTRAEKACYYTTTVHQLFQVASGLHQIKP
ncbi:hypothetical protein THRCLA_11732 [Thraustotheca clavata]|uniref:Uncharacterized protein n=1 Tax=Thraustotheca clavata TaxID=74557 RepID=A0A1V9Y6Y4_9STRA|nr:hypothetical protein THRCLA_11732 [Thraustotheca clavata]